MDDFNSSNNPIYGKFVKLDCGMISDILSSYIVASPDEDPFFLPGFRITHLCDRASAFFRKDGDLMEAVGSIYCLCFCFASTPKIELSDPIEKRAILLLQAVACECLAVLQEDTKLEFKHPLDVYGLLSSENLDMYGTFEECYEIAKNITREIMDQVKGARDKQDPRTKHSKKNARNVQTDCYKPHTIYFMCCLSLAHVCGILVHKDVVFKCPGIMELMLLSMIITPKIAAPPKSGIMANTRDEHLKRQMRNLIRRKILIDLINVFY